MRTRSTMALGARFLGGALIASTLGCGEARAREAEPQQASATTTVDEKLYRDMARLSWSYLNSNYQASTGFVNATPDWYNTTLWDLGGQLLAFQAAKELGLLSKTEYE